jgi:hypothetical protein
MYDEPLDTVLLGLLGDSYWGEKALRERSDHEQIA